MIPPNTSSERDAEPPAKGGAAPGEGVRALVERLAQEFGADLATLTRVATLFEEARERTPDIFVPAAGGLGAAFAAVVASGGEDAAPIHAALGEWALDAENEPLERMRRDCLRFQNALTRTALRLHAYEEEQCAESLLALDRYIFLQVGLLASLAARSQSEGGVVRTLPTPEYAAFMEIFRTTIEAHRQEGKQLGLLILQIAKVEQIDRLLGLQKGEAFMLRVTRRMREGVLRKQDQLGRVSRDQFACLLPRIAGEGVALLAANKILDALQPPIPLGDRAFPVDAAIGIAMYPDHGADPQTLVRNAKLAAVVARGEAERVTVYDPVHGASEERSMLYETRLREALERSTLEIVLTPQLNLQSGRVAGLTSVLRWKDAQLGEVAEAHAIDAAEKSGLTRELTWWTYNNALRMSAELTDAGTKLPVSLKVTAAGLGQPDFAEFVGRALRTWKVAPQQVTIEIHETALAGSIEALKVTLAELKALGVRLGIGGFGTASSSLSNLSQLPLDEAKIGAVFVCDMLQVPAHAKIVTSLIHLAQDLGLVIGAEGVDTVATSKALVELGCIRAEGACIGDPLTVQEALFCEVGADGPARLPLRPKV
ncbi:MAG: hypothetical protein JWN94_1060 [Betaproteobacteria bacterium]|nr:hypothetical protein [Betaproteobacteria bacterium]